MTSPPIRALSWSVTINNPTEKDLDFSWIEAKPGWSIQGQMEKGSEGTPHYQGCLKTPNKPAFSTIKKCLPRAHIEKARNAQQLEAYVHKEETRLSLVDTKKSEIPTLFAYQRSVASKLHVHEIDVILRLIPIEKYNEENVWIKVHRFIDNVIKDDITAGVRGIEFIAINPMWLSSWKKFWREIITRENGRTPQSDSPFEEAGAQGTL